MKHKILLLVLATLTLFGCLNAQPYTVSGTVYVSPDGLTQTPIEGARVWSVAPYVAETTTDASGNYVFENVPSNSLLTIYAEKAGYTFSPAYYERLVMQNYSNLDFTGTVLETFSVSGTITSSSVGLEGVLVSSSDGQTATTNSSGYYSISGITASSITLTPAFDGYSFTPSSLTLTMGQNYIDKNFIATSTARFSVSGTVVTTERIPLEGVLVSSSEGRTATTNSSGYYSISGITASNITLTPALDGYGFSPESIELEMTQDYTDRNFTATSTEHTGFSVSGTVTTTEKIPLEGVLLSSSDGQTATTNSSGYYSISGITAQSITLTPALDGYSFTPSSLTLTMDQNYTEQNFTASEGSGNENTIQYSISGTVTVCDNPLEGVTIENDGQYFYTNSEGEYTVTGTLIFNGTYYEPDRIDLAFSKSGYIITRYESNVLSFSSVDLENNPERSGQDLVAIKEIDSVAGKLTYPDGTPASTITINVFDDKTGESISEITTDEEGYYYYPITYYNMLDESSSYSSYTFEPESEMFVFEPTTISVNNFQTCSNLKEKDFQVNVAPTPICMVSVSDNGKNIVVWEKPANEFISGFKIYREGNQAGVYEVLDTVSYDDIAVYEDVNSDPSAKAYRYKIGTVTTFDGIETDLSSEHKTIHLTINKGVGSSWNLIWSSYEGIEVSTYKLYRGTSVDDMTFLTDIAGSLNSYTDNNAPAGDVFYQIEMLLEDACNPVIAKSLLRSMADDISYYSTKSNIVNSIGAVGMDNIFAEKNLIYPNPVDNLLYFIAQGSFPFELYSTDGSLIKMGLLNVSTDVSTLKIGLYYIKIKVDSKWTTYKFVKE